MDILKKIWDAPVFVYQLNELKYMVIGEHGAWNVSSNGIVYGAYCMYFEKTVDDLVNQKMLGITPVGEEIIKSIEACKYNKPEFTDYSEFEKICVDSCVDKKSLETQFEKISELRKRLGIN